MFTAGHRQDFERDVDRCDAHGPHWPAWDDDDQPGPEHPLTANVTWIEVELTAANAWRLYVDDPRVKIHVLKDKP